MWTTLDGYTLRLPRSRVAKIASRLSKTGMKDLVIENFDGSIARAVVRSIGRIASNSHRIGTTFYGGSDCGLPTFQASINGRQYQIYSAPLNESEHAILTVRSKASEDQPEFIAIAGSATISWDAPATFGKAIRTNTNSLHDVYMLEKRDASGQWKPYYVGRTDDTDDRLQKHRRDILRHQNRLSDYRVRVGHITAASKLTPAEVERVLIRKLKRAVSGVTNAGSDAKPFLIPKGKRVQLQHQGKAPAVVLDRRRKTKSQVISGGKQGRQYEFEFEMPFSEQAYP